MRIFIKIAKATRLCPFIYKCFCVIKNRKLKDAINKCVKSAANRTGRSELSIMADMSFKCYMTGASFYDYFRFRFYEKSFAETDRYLNNDRYWHMYDSLSTPRNRKIMNEKWIFNQVFKDFVKRDWVHITPESSVKEIEAFVNKHPVFIGKRENLNMGQGIQLIDSSEFSGYEDLLSFLKKHMLFLIEQRVENHESLKKYSKASLNTLRVITVRHPEGIKIIGVLFKFGDGDNLADSPGVGYKCPVDPETGTIHSGVTGSGFLEGRFIPRHPAGYEMIGIKIPYWEELVVMVKKAAMLLDDCYYVPWDVAVTPTGPLIIEGNCNCGYYYQWVTGRPTYHDMKKACKFAKTSQKRGRT